VKRFIGPLLKINASATSIQNVPERQKEKLGFSLSEKVFRKMKSNFPRITDIFKGKPVKATTLNNQSSALHICQNSK
jgi:hypothetical protein